MTTIQHSRPAAPTEQARHPGRYAGLVFVVAFVPAFVLLVGGPNIYEGGTLADFAAAHADDARILPSSILAILLMPAAAAAFVVTAAFLRRQLEHALGGPTLATRITTIGAAATATALTIASAGLGAATHVATGSSDGGFPADAAAGHALSLFSSQVFATGLWGASVLLVGVAIAARTTGQLPGWLRWAGIVTAVLLPVAWILAFPWLLLLLWLAAACFMMKTDVVVTRD